MKRFKILAALLISLQSFGQNQINFKPSSEVSFLNPEINLIYKEFIKNQEKPFLKANSESFKLNEIIWSRPFGEERYCLTPDINNIDNYLNRINSGNNKGFGFIEVELNKSSIELLKKININVPDYAINSIICYLPSIDIEFLNKNGINYTELFEYGNNMSSYSNSGNKNNTPKALIWSEGFESNAVPGNNYNAVNGATNCGWKDVSCYSNGGDWSVWCAGNGAACNNCLEDYVNDMETNFAPTNYLNVSGFNDIFFNYSIDLDLNNSGTNDEFLRFEDLGSGTWSLAFSANSGNSIDGQLWQNLSVNYTGQSFNNYAFNFGFTSNFTGTSYGVYLDDLQLTGNSTANLNEIEVNQQFEIYPNPSNGVFNLEINKNNNNPIYLSVLNLSCQLVYSEKFELINNNHIKTIDLNELEKGVYSIQLKSEDGIINKKLVIK
tara:strand:- start:11353 stop:12663 length:1311 start_codon:yes stop_codon:yes gene_type:complete